jgi:hypothetical protein
VRTCPLITEEFEDVGLAVRGACARLVVTAAACDFSNSLSELAASRQTVLARHAQSRRAGPQ